MPKPEPRYLGGQAVIEGVMMRGLRSWAVAVRTPEGDIETEVHDAPRWSERYIRVPLLRGVITLAESLTLGLRALTWSADRQVPEEDRLSKGAIGGTMAFALLLFAGVFIVAPAFAARGLGRFVAGDGFWLHVLEGGLRLGIFLAYLFVISRLSDVRRVFEYHGAEHKAIAAYENGAELTPESAQRFTTEHVRCGTNFLLTVMVVAIITYSFVGRPGWMLLIVSRVLLLPVIAGISYEIIRFAARHMDRGWVRVAMRPGLALQRLTTRQPTLDQLEVAIASVRAVLTAEQLAEIEHRNPVPAQAPHPAPA